MKPPCDLPKAITLAVKWLYAADEFLRCSLLHEEVVLEWIHKIDPFYSAYGKDYYRIVVEYLEMIKIN